MRADPGPQRVRRSAQRTGARSDRPNIADIAALAEVSTSAVSYALNGRPGISDATRARILAIADQARWRPNRAAQTLNTDRAGAIGVVTVGRLDQSARPEHSAGQPDQPLWTGSFGGFFLAGVQAELARADVLLTMRQVDDVDEEIAQYRRWLAERRVDGVLVVNPESADPRSDALDEIGLPAVVVGDTRRQSSLSCVWTDDKAAIDLAVDHLADLGHRHIARIGGSPRRLHFKTRDRAFRRALSTRGLSASGTVLMRDERGAGYIRDLVADADEPLTAIVVEDMEYALHLVANLRMLGVSVPEDISVIAWGDSSMSRFLVPTLTELHRDITGYGRITARELMSLIATGERRAVRGTVTELVVRDSTAAPKSR